ncbi:DUF11 domain-containing protein [Microbacterium sp. BWT-B31]|uniref:DUF7927 domain-containing protein n=1 Tax=Microbacterium sp. BWT-B31 TaxID=3232072 RepID=UPI003526DD8C
MPTVFVAQSALGGTTGLYRAETSGDGSYAFSPEGPALTGGTYNAIAFNSADGYIYGAVVSDIGDIPARSLVRIGQSGTVARVGGNLFGATQWIGAFNPEDGLLYTTHGTSELYPMLYAANVQTGSINAVLPLSGQWVFADMEYQGGYFWAINYLEGPQHNSILRIDPRTGEVKFFPGVIPAEFTGPWGAVWRFGNGNLGFSNNATGTIAQVKITGATTESPVIELVTLVDGPASSGNDGTAIPGLPADLRIEKTTPAMFEAGGRVTYELTVTNDGPGISSGWLVIDPLDPNLENIVVTGPAMSVVEDGVIKINGGRMAPGDAVTMQISADAYVEPDVCLTNTATVIGNEADPEHDNDADTAESCAVWLAIEKTTDATSASRPPDTVTYTVTATNIGAGDYTEAQPAVIIDDLSAVLDDAVYNLDAHPTRPGGWVQYAEPLLQWSGPLASGRSVSLTYSVTLQPGGDGRVRNVAWQPADPSTPTTPDCDGTTARSLFAAEPCATTEFLLPKLSITKTTDRTELPAVGERLRYTVTVTNPGPGDFTEAAPASATDDLAGVLDDATLDLATITASAGQVSHLDGVLSWSGPLAAGASASISYEVVYTGAGDRVLENSACVDEVDLAAGQEPCATTAVPGAALNMWKTVTSSDVPAVEGSVLTYTLFFENEGLADAVVSAVDLLEHLVDDAEITSEPTSDTLSVVRDVDRITITGTVAPNTIATVTYAATVKPDGSRGDDHAANFLVPDDPDDPQTPPQSNECQPADPQFPDCTATPIGAISFVKSVTASASPLRAGSVLTYTIDIVNTGATLMVVDRDDILTDVLDDATLLQQPTSDAATVTTTNVVGDAFSIRGTLPAGGRAKVTYSVTLKDVDERGNNTAVNFLLAPGDAAPAECAAEDPTCTVTPLPALEASKRSDPETGSRVIPGQVVAYTLTFTNSGEAAAEADYTDDLRDVLDDAALTAGPQSSNPAIAAVLTGEQLRIEGPLLPGETAVVSYEVTVRADDERGDDRLANLLAENGREHSGCDDSAVSCTEHGVPRIVAVKSVDPESGSTVHAGNELVYTLAFENDGAAPGDVAFVDHLAGVLDDAELVGAVTASGQLSADGPTGGQLTITGPLAPGERATVSYTVRVASNPGSGDRHLVNFLTPAGLEPAGVCVASDPRCTENPIAPPPSRSELPFTGSVLPVGAAIGAALLLLAGGAVLAASWRRRDALSSRGR